MLQAEVNDIMKEDSAYIISFIQGYDTSLASKSALEQEEELNTLSSMVEQWIGYRDEDENSDVVNAINNGAQFVADTFRQTNPVEASSGEEGDNDSLNPYINKNLKQNKYKYNKAAVEAAKNNTEGSTDTNGTSSGSNASSMRNYYLDMKLKVYGMDENGLGTVRDLDTSVTGKGTTSEKAYQDAVIQAIPHLEALFVRMKTADPDSQYWGMEITYPENLMKEYDMLTQGYSSPNRRNVIGFAKGGEVDYTGPAMVHGSKSHPEYMLNADEYQTWKKNIVGGGNNSLMSRLSELNSLIGSMEDTRKYGTHSSNESFNIESASVNMYVDEIANDYDAQRAGEQALSKILEIARKGAGSNRVGR